MKDGGYVMTNIKKYELKKRRSFKEMHNLEGWREVPKEKALKDFKRHMNEVGSIVKYYRQKEREGLEKAITTLIGCHS